MSNGSPPSGCNGQAQVQTRSKIARDPFPASDQENVVSGERIGGKNLNLKSDLNLNLNVRIESGKIVIQEPLTPTKKLTNSNGGSIFATNTTASGSGISMPPRFKRGSKGAKDFISQTHTIKSHVVDIINS